MSTTVRGCSQTNFGDCYTRRNGQRIDPNTLAFDQTATAPTKQSTTATSIHTRLEYVEQLFVVMNPGGTSQLSYYIEMWVENGTKCRAPTSESMLTAQKPPAATFVMCGCHESCTSAACSSLRTAHIGQRRLAAPLTRTPFDKRNG